ncbi:hypothetical protein F5Y10DRAFT_25014 [Nemania abortiva]|nr:hypothetical protein F5Y10DRAFT_25014 [Nemania abortiva]
MSMRGPSHVIADDESGGAMCSHPGCEASLHVSAQPMPYDHHPQHDTEQSLESLEENTEENTETETIFSQDDESAVTGSTDYVPSPINGYGYNEKETITVPSVDDEAIFHNQPGGLSGHNLDPAGILSSINPVGSPATVRDPVPNVVDFKDGSTSTLPNDDIITPRMNWRDYGKKAPDSVDEAITLFNAEFNGAGIPYTATLNIGDDLIPARTVAVAGRAAAGDGRPLKYEEMHEKVDQTLLSSPQLKEVLSPENLQRVCKLCKVLADFPPDAVDRFLPRTELQPPRDEIRAYSKDIVDSLLQIITLGSDEEARKAKCASCRTRLNTAEIAALRFGLDKTITLHLLENGEPITFVCCDETFPSPEWAEEAAKAFLEGAELWAKAGLTFKQVDRSEPAHFRIAFSLFPKDLDCSVVAHSFFPGKKQPEDRTLWVYLLAFHEDYRPYMAGHMGHEAGHIGGARHGFDEHLLPDGSEIAEWKTVKMGADHPLSVMNYHNNPGDYAVQPSDIADMRNMHEYPGNEYQGYKIIKVKPEVRIYSSMQSFESIAEYLLNQA